MAGPRWKTFFMTEMEKIQVLTLFSSRSENIVKRLELRKVRMDFVAFDDAHACVSYEVGGRVGVNGTH